MFSDIFAKGEGGPLLNLEHPHKLSTGCPAQALSRLLGKGAGVPPVLDNCVVVEKQAYDIRF